MQKEHGHGNTGLMTLCKKQAPTTVSVTQKWQAVGGRGEGGHFLLLKETCSQQNNQVKGPEQVKNEETAKDNTGPMLP